MAKLSEKPWSPGRRSHRCHQPKPRGRVLEARKFPEISKVYGARHGRGGILNEDFLDLTQATTHNWKRLRAPPPRRSAPPATSPTRDTAQMFKVMLAHEIGTLLHRRQRLVGHLPHREQQAKESRLRAAHHARAQDIDNDLVGTDHCPGFGSAGKFVAQAFAARTRTTALWPGVYIAVVMGRHAGFLTAASVFARKYPDDGPHLIYVTGTRLQLGAILSRTCSRPTTSTPLIIAVSEGVCGPDGQRW